MYLLTLTGIYDHGALGIFADPKDAEEYARDLYEKSDGYHAFRLQNLKLNQRIEPKEDLGKPVSWETKVPFEEAFTREE